MDLEKGLKKKGGTTWSQKCFLIFEGLLNMDSAIGKVLGGKERSFVG